MSKLVLCFSEIPKTFICGHVRQVTFLYEDWKKSVWSSVLFTVSALEMHERKAYKKQTGSNVSALLNKVSTLEHDRFMQVSLKTHMIICEYSSLSHKPDYQGSRLNNYQFVSLFRWFK